MNPQGIDFAACLEVLVDYPSGVAGGAISDMWFDITWASAKLGLHQPGAVEHLMRAARAADQLHALHAFDIVLRFLAIAAAEAGLGEHAHALVAYSEANLRQHRMENPQQTWAQGRLDELFAGFPKPASEAALARGEIMRTISEIEGALT